MNLSDISEDAPFSVGEFLDILNGSFAGIRVAVRGEISGIEERRGITYFSLKDTEADGMLSCLIFRSGVSLQDAFLEEGMEVIVEGMPTVWKPRGRLSFRVSSVRLAGEGALRKAYDALRAKLDREGIFSPDRKRALPRFPERIALLTSREGAAIGDFMANIGRYGFSISLFDAHVEGSRAVSELLRGIRFFNANASRWDVLVVIRGGGSLESLEAFNSEEVVRAIAESTLPVIAGVGHEKDVSLAALAADSMVSTPTAAALALGVSWEAAGERARSLERDIVDRFQHGVFDMEERFRYATDVLREAREGLLAPFRMMERKGERAFSVFSEWRERVRMKETYLARTLARVSDTSFARARLVALESRINSRNPKRLLEKGYVFLTRNSRVICSVAEISPGDRLDLLLADGSIQAEALSKTSKNS